MQHGSLPIDPSTGRPDYSSIDASPISMVLTSAIRRLLIEEVGVDRVPHIPHRKFEGVLNPVREVNDMKGTARQVQVRAKRVFAGILPELGIGWVIPIWRKAIQPIAPQWMSNYAFVLVFTTLFPWLMGPMKGVDHVEVEVPEGLRKVTFNLLPERLSVPQSVKAERCRFVETTGCASVCVNTCKVPSQEWLLEDFGMPMHIQPNYDDFSCKWEFSKPAPPLEEDEAVMVPCFSQCLSEYKGEKDAVRQRMRARMGVGIEGGVDKYTGETLEQIASRASAEAKADAAAPSPQGSAANDASLAVRLDSLRDAQSGGKCWSVDDDRLDLVTDMAKVTAAGVK